MARGWGDRLRGRDCDLVSVRPQIMRGICGFPSAVVDAESMAMRNVSDLMNPELFATRISDDVGDTLAMILRLGITAAPVVDAEGMPIGVISLRDLAAASPGDVVGTHMTSPACTIAADAQLEDAARVMGATEYHHLVVVDADSRTCGFLSALDVVRGLVGMTSEHPPAFHQLDPDSGLSWTGPMVLDQDGVQAAPARAGLVSLVKEGDAPGGEVVWTEAATDLRAHLERLVAGKISLPEELRNNVRDGKLKIRTAEFDRGGRSLAEAIEGDKQ